VKDLGKWPGQVAAAIADGNVAAWFSDQGVDVVHLGIIDTSGTLREKRLPAPVAATAFERGWSFIDAIQSWDPADNTFTDDGATHLAARVDAASGRPYPFEPAAATFFSEFTGPPGELSGRRQLERMVDRAAALGIEARVGWEFECIVVDQSAADLEASGGVDLLPAAPANRCWSALTPAVHAGVISDLTDTLGAADVPVHHTCVELGPGCLEIALQHRPALRAADDGVVAKLCTKALFARRGQTATFMAQLGDEFPGLGGHPSLSLWDTDGQPLLAGDGQYGLSKTAGAAIAGIVRTLPELLVMAAHTVNAYRRYSPGNWAPRQANWGPGNYATALRAVADRPDEARLELRIPGADTSPHLCLAMMLGAAVWGIERVLEAPPPVVPPMNGRDVVDPGIGRLPRSLLEAAERFERSAVAAELFGAPFVSHFSRSRVAEDAACRKFVAPQERLRYLHQV